MLTNKYSEDKKQPRHPPPTTTTPSLPFSESLRIKGSAQSWLPSGASWTTYWKAEHCLLSMFPVLTASEPVNVNEFEELARQALPKNYYDFFAAGAEDQHTLRENIKAFSRITLQPRVLVDVGKIDASTTILGCKISSPIIIAPASLRKLPHPEEIGIARAAAACNTIMVLSFMSTCTVEEVASSCNAVQFLQYFKIRDTSAQVVQRAERNGFKAILLTVDSPRQGRREADIKNRMVSPLWKKFDPSTKFSNDIAWLKSITNLPILIKGVLTREDAIKGVEVGVSGIIVSNHGARQLDFVPATTSVLEEVVHAVGGRVPVLLDGGIRRGTDIFKALALGAQAVLVGRPAVYGLISKGERGVRRVIEMLKDEFEITMALSGCSTMKDISRRHVRTEQDRLQSML